MAKESRTSFVNRVMGLSLKSTQGKYSYCNDNKKEVLFSLNKGNGDIILSPTWSRNGYSHSLKHINKIRNEGYTLFVFETYTKKNNNGQTVACGFSPSIEKRKLIVENDVFRAVLIDGQLEDGDFLGIEKYIEGATKTITVNGYERNREARQMCLKVHGCICSVCDFNFEQEFGEIGKGFIHVHHLKPLAEIGNEYELHPVEDLRPVCPNCHAMLHRKRPAYSIEELQQIRIETGNRITQKL